MIHWTWLIVAVMVGACIGFWIACLLVGTDVDDDIDRWCDERRTAGDPPRDYADW